MNKEFVSPSFESAKVEQLTLQLFETNQKLTILQKERETMLANISHDLRAPITAIRGAIDLSLSQSQPSSDELLNTILIIDRRTKTLEDLINDMYYLFCIEDQSRPLCFTTLSAGPFLEEYFFDIEFDKRYENFEMILDVPMDLDCKINVDTQKFLRVLDNLFTNAAKYSRDGNKLSIKLSAQKKNKTSLEIKITDSGKGIPKEVIPYLFTRTYTVSNARTPDGSNSGSGLGLSIAKAIVERHNGTISCESTLNVGTSFIIELPCE